MNTSSIPSLFSSCSRFRWPQFALAALSVLFIAAGEAQAQTFTNTYSTAGTTNFTIPAGVTQLTVQAWGAGGGGRSLAVGDRAPGGGGGAYASSAIAVTSGVSYTIIVGAGGNPQDTAIETGGVSKVFSGSVTNVLADGGVGGTGNNGGAGGSAAASIGTTTFSGGAGGNRGSNGGGGGGGGGSAFTNADGGAGAAGTTTGNGAGGIGFGNGGTGGVNNAAAGAPGFAPGGGGGGDGDGTSAGGGAGAQGRVIIVYTISVTTPAKLAFTNAPTSIYQGQTSSVLTVELRTTNNLIATATNNVTVSLSSIPAGTFLDPVSSSIITSVVISNGQSEASFRYTSASVGTNVLTVSNSVYGATNQNLVVAAIVPSKIIFTTAPQSIPVGTTSAVISISLQNVSNLTALATNNVTVNLSSSIAGTFRDASGASVITSVVVTNGTSSASFLYTSANGGVHTLTASNSALGATNQTITITTPVLPPVAIVFTTAPQTIAYGTTSAVITVQLRDATNGTALATNTVQINLSSSLPGTFLNAGTTSVITFVTITNGQSTASFRYTSTTPGSHGLGAQHSLLQLTGDSQVLTMQESVLGGPPSQTYMVPISMVNLMTVWTNMNTASFVGTNAVVTLSIVVAASNTVIYYDKFVDGYETSVANSTQSTTLVWGDGNLANGVAPGYPSDLIRAGGVVLLTETVGVPVASAVVTNIYQGGDEISGTRPIAVSLVAWGQSIGPINAEGEDLYDTSKFGTDFYTPIGTNTYTASTSFQIAKVAMMPAQNNTMISLDYNGDGTVDVVYTNVARGQSVLSTFNVSAGAHIFSDKPIQCQLMSGSNLAGGPGAESRWFELYSSDQWSTDYVTPVWTTLAANPSLSFLFNPTTNTLSVRYQFGATTLTTNILAKSVVIVSNATTAVGGRFYTTNGVKFQAVQGVDIPGTGAASGQTYDWGFNMIPADSLTAQAIVGFGAGSSDYSVNTAPIWVTALTNATLYIDYDGDPTTGTLTDNVGRAYNTNITLTGFGSVRVYNPSGNSQTGMRIYTISNIPLAIAWGEDPSVAAAGNPHIDAGTSVQPLVGFSAFKTAALTNDLTGNGRYDPGDGILYTITVKNEGFDVLTNVVVQDTLPANIAYVTNTTKLGGSLIPDSVVPTNATYFPLDESGYIVPVLGVNSSVVFQFVVTITNPFPQNVGAIINTAKVTAVNSILVRTAIVPMEQTDLIATKTVTPSSALVGSNVTFTMSVSNAGPTNATGVVGSDLLPAGLSFVSSSSGDYSAGPGIWSIGKLNVGSVTSLTIVATITAPGYITNRISAIEDQADPTPANNIATAVVLGLQTGVGLTKTLVSPLGRPAAINEDFIFAITVSNTGTVTLTTVPVVDTFNTNLLTLVSQTPQANSTNLAAGTLTWTNVGPLLAGQSTVITTRFIAAKGGVGTNVVVTTPTTTNGLPVTPKTNSAVHAAVSPAVTISKTVTSPVGGTGVLGQPYVFTMIVSNSGDIALDTVPLTDSFSNNLISVVSQTPPANSTNIAQGTLSWTNIGPLSVGGFTTVTATFSSVSAGVGTNHAVTTPTLTNGIPVSSKTSSVPFTVISPTIAISKTLLSPLGRPAAVGETISFQITISNSASIALNPVALEDDFNTNLLSIVSQSPGASSTNLLVGMLSWTNLGLLLPGSSSVVTVNFTAISSGLGSNVAITRPSTTNGIPLNPSTSSVPHTAVNPRVDIVKTIVAPLGRPAATGEVVTFRISVTNSGDTVINTMTVSDTYNATLLSFLNATGTQSSAAGNLITWSNVGPLAVGATTNFQVQFTALAAGVGTNVAVTIPTITNGIPVPPKTNSVPHTNVNPRVDIVKTIVAPLGRPAATGEVVTFRISVTNSGDTVINTMTVSDTYNTTLLSFLNATATQSSAAGNLITWSNVGPLAVGGVTNFQVQFTALAAGVGTNVAVTVPVITNGIPVPPKTNSVPHTNVNPKVTILKSLISPTNRPAVVGETNVFTILVSNTGNIPLDIVPVTDTFRSELLAFVSASPAPDAANINSLVWSNVGPLTLGGSVTLTARFVTVISGTGTNSAITTPSTTNGVPVPPATSSVPHTTVSPSYLMTKTIRFPVDRAAATNEIFTFEVAITNTGNIPLDVVPLVDTFNTNFLSFVSASPTQNTVVGNTITWSNVGPLAVGGSTVVTSRFLALKLGIETNFVATFPITTNGVPVPPSTSSVPHEAVVLEVNITKTLLLPFGRPAFVGETNVFEIKVYNGGSVLLDTVPLLDTYNTNLLKIVSQSPGANSTNLANGTLSWTNIGPIAATTSSIVVVRFVALANGTGTNVAFSAPSTTNGLPVPAVTDSAPHTAVTPGVAIFKTVTSPTNRAAAIGETVIFTVTVTNTGNVKLDTLPLDDSFQTNLLSYLSSTPPADSFASNLLQWTDLGSLGVGSSTSVIIRFTALTNGVGTNVVVTVPTTTNGIPVPPKTNEVPHTNVNPRVDIVKTLVAPLGRPAVTGEVVTFRISVTNSGDTVIDTMTVNDTYNTTLLSFLNATGTQSSAAGNLITWSNVGPLAVGGATNFIVQFTAIASGTGTNVAVTVPVITNGIPVPPQTNGVPHTNVAPRIDYAKVLVSPLGRPAVTGEVVTFRITVTNSGNYVWTNLIPVTDSYDTNLLSFLNATSTPSSVGIGSVNWTNLGPLNAGSSTSVVLQFRAIASGVGTNYATAVTNPPVFTNVAPRIDYAKVLVSPLGRPAVTGEVVTFRITVTNFGNYVWTNLIPVTDSYDTNLLSFLNATSTPSSVGIGSVNWTNLGPLNAGSSTSVVLQFRAIASGVGTNYATAVTNPPVFTNVAPRIDYAKVLVSPLGRPAVTGEVVTFRITVTNSGNYVWTNLIPVTDSYDTNLLSFLNATSTPSSVGIGSVNWTNLGPLNAGSSTSVVLQFRAIASGVGTNYATAVTNPPVFTNVNPKVTIVKSLISPSGRPAAVGETNVFTLVVSNTGDYGLDIVPVVDEFDSTKMTFLSAAPAPNVTNVNSVLWSNVGPLTVGGSVTLTARFIAVSSGTGTNTGITTPSTTNGVPVPPSTSSVPHTTVAPAYTVNKAVVSPSGRPAAIGEAFVFAITVTNTGNIALDTVPLNDTFKTNYLTIISQTPPANGTNLVTGLLSWTNIGPLLVGQSRTVTVSFTAITAGTETNFAALAPTTTNGVPLPPSTSSVPHTAVAPAVTITKSLISPSGRPAVVGETNVFTITVFNGGAIVLDTVPVVDTYNTNLLSILSQSPGANGTNLGVGTLTWTNVGPLGIGGTSVITARFVTVANGTGTNVALATPSTTNGVPVPPVTSSVPHTAVTPGITIVKTLSAPTGRPAVIGEQVQFTISVTNTGNVLLDTVPLTDIFNTNLLGFVSATPPQTSLAGSLLSWTNIGPIGAGQSSNVIVWFTALTNGIGTNVVVTIPTTTNGIPVPPKTNEVPHTNVNVHVDYAKVLVSPLGRPAVTGEVVTFRITVTNSGEYAYTNLIPVTDSYDTNLLSFLNATSTPSSVGIGSVNWTNLGPLAQGSSTSVVLQFRAIASGVGTNYATAVTNPPVFTNVAPRIDYAKVLVSPLGRPAVTGEVVTFRITVTNSGNYVWTNLIPVTDSYDTNLLSFLNATSTPSSVGIGSVNWTNLGPLNAGSSTSVVLQFRAIASGVGTNYATAVTNPPVFTNVAPRIDYAKVLVSPLGRPAVTGEVVTFRITVTNFGNYVWTNLIPVTDSYDTNLLSFLNATSTPSSVGIGSVNWTNLGPLNAGSSTSVVLQFRAIASGVGTNYATAVTNPPVFTNVAPRIDYAKVLVSPLGRPAVTGEVVTFRITVTNSGNYVWTNLIPVTDSYDTNLLSFLNATSTPSSVGIGSVNWTNLGPLNAGSSTSVVLQFRAIASGVGTNYATAVTNPPVFTNVAPRIDYAKVLVSPLGRPAVTGEVVTFRITVTNFGNYVWTNLIPVTDSYDTNLLSFLNATSTPSSVGIGSVNWTNLGPLNAGSSTSVVLQFRAIASGVGTNYATAVTNPPVFTNVAPRIDYAKVLVSPLGRPAVTGEVVTFRITVTNFGNYVWTNLIPVTDSYDTNLLSFLNATSTPSSVGIGSVNWTNLGPLNAGSSTSVVLQFRAIASGVGTNYATAVTNPPVFTNVAPRIDYAKVLVSPLGRPAVTGEVVTFRITVTNSGNYVWTNLIPVTDSYDTNLLSFLNATSTPSSVGIGSVNWTNLGPLNAGSSTSVVLQFRAIASGVGTNYATAVTNPPVFTNVAPRIDYAKVLVSPLGRPAVTGEVVTFRITVTNFGNYVWTNLIPVTDSYDTNLLSFLNATSTPSSVGIGSVNWTNLGPLNAGSSTSVVLQFRAIASGVGTNYATAVTNPPVFTNVAPRIDYAKVLVSPLGRPAVTGEVVTFRITVTNFGNYVWTNLIPVTDSYDTNLLSFLNATSTPSSVGIGSVNWTNLGPLNAGSSTSVVLQFRAIASGVGTNYATAVTNPPVFTNVNPKVTIVKSLISPSGRPAAVGEEFVFAITVSNAGDVVLATVPVTDTYNTSYISYISSIPVSDDNANDGTINWTNLGPIASGGSITITSRFTALIAGIETNRVATAPTTTNGVPVQPQTNEVPHTAVQPGYTLVKTLNLPDEGPAFIGQTVSFNIGIVNTGSVPLAIVNLVDLYDATKLAYTNATPLPDMVSSGIITWSNVGPVAVGANTNIYVQFTAIGSTYPGNTTNFAISSVTYSSGVPTTPQTSSAPVEIAANATIGDFVWLDTNPNGVQELSEPGVANVKVSLYDASTNLLATTNTSGSGYYTFDVNPGAYFLQFDAPPGFNWVTPNVTTNDNVDSDVDYTSGRTIPFTLVAGQIATNWDAGMYRASTYNLIADVKGVLQGSIPVLTWQTSREAGDAYFEVSRRSNANAAWQKIHSDSLPAIGSAILGASYRQPDAGAQAGGSYEYQIISIDIRGNRTVRGPYAVNYPTTSAGLLSVGPVEFTASENVQNSALETRYQEAALPQNNSVLALGQSSTDVRVTIAESGLYSISATQLAQSFGVALQQIEDSLLNQTVAVEHLGRSVSVLYSSNALSFYAEALHTMYTDQNIYWVKLAPGAAMHDHAASSVGAVYGQTFTAEVTIETNTTLLVEQFTNPKTDPWVGRGLLWTVPQLRSYQTACSLPGAASGNHIVVRLLGRSVSADNLVVVSVNGKVVGTNHVSGMGYQIFTNNLAGIPISASSNIVNIAAISGTPDYVFVDNYTVNYERSYVAQGNELKFADAGHEVVTLSGFGSSDIELFDISVPERPTRISGLNADTIASGYGVSFQPTSSGGRYVAVCGAFRRQPASVVPDVPSNLRDQQNEADYLAITFAGLSANVQSLVNYRSSHGLASKLIDVQDIYDEFNFGVADPRAIRAFLGYAYRMWARSPRYVVLVGEGSLDYRNYRGFNDCRIPPLVAGGSFGLQASDQLYGDVDGDGTAEISIGRLPVLTSTEFQNAFAKLQAYEVGGSWKAKALSLADSPDIAGQFEVDSDYLASLTPAHLQDKNFIRTQSLASAHSALMSSLNEGRGLFTYFGHANGQQLTMATNIFGGGDVASLNNATKPPLMLALTCLVGDYGRPGFNTLSEQLVGSSNGAAAVWAAGKQQFDSDGRGMGSALASNLFVRGTARVGDAIIAANRANAGNMEACQAYSLLGDPAMAVGDMNSQRPGNITPNDRPSYAEWVSWAIAPAVSDSGVSTAMDGDIDGDGTVNGDEYIAGTNPLDKDSILVFIDTAKATDGQVLVQWQSAGHRVYQLERMTDLVNGSYTIIGTDLLATPPVNAFTDNVNNASTLIYRVRVK